MNALRVSGYGRTTRAEGRILLVELNSGKSLSFVQFDE